MKRFSWVLWCILAGMSSGCDNYVAIDPDVANCIKVGGMIENGKCKCDSDRISGCINELAYTCEKGIYQIAECGDASTCEENGTKYGENLSCKSGCTGDACSEENSKNILICINGAKLEKKCANVCEKGEGGDKCTSCTDEQRICNEYGQRCAADGTWEKCDPNFETEIGKECDGKKTKCSEEEGHEDQVLECDDGFWELKEACSVGKICKNGACVEDSGNGETSDNNECSGNVTKCDGTNMLQTCVDGKWNGGERGEPCPNGQICKDGACVENSGNGETSDNNECSGNVTKCDGTNMLQTCVDGKWNGGEPCPNGQICTDGTCIANSGNSENPEKNQCKVEDGNITLENGKTICINNKAGIGELHTCNDNGDMTLEESCESVSCKCSLSNKCLGDGETCGDCKNEDKQCNGATSQICENGSWKNNEICEGGCDTNTGECNLNDSCQSYESLWETINNDDEKCLLNEKMLQEIINRLKASNHNNNIKPQATFFIVSEKQSYSFRVAANIDTNNYELYYSDDNAITSKNGKLNICKIGLPVEPYGDALRELQKSQISGIALLEFDADSEKCSTIVNIPNEEMSLICNNDESSKWTCNDNNVLMCANNKLYQLGFEGNDYSWQSKSSIDYSKIDWDVSENTPWHTQNEELLCKINKNLIENAYKHVNDSYKLYVKVKGENESIKCESGIDDIKKCGNRSLEEICKKEISEISIWEINNKETPRYSCQTANLSISDLCNDIRVSSEPSQTGVCGFVTDGT